LPSYIGIRETYHIKSRYRIKTAEVLGGAKFPDAIGNGSYRTDRHHNSDSGITFKYLNGESLTIAETGMPGIAGRWRDETPENPTYYQIPYRALVPATPITNLLFAGRMIDAEEEAFSALRVMVNTNQMGEAAGVAAALAIKTNSSAQAVEVSALRRTLADVGAVIL
jgi:hypothetical protein